MTKFFLSQPPTLIVVSIGNMNVCYCHKFYELYQVTITYIFGNILTCIWSYHFGHVKQPLYFPLFYYFVLFIFCFILFSLLSWAGRRSGGSETDSEEDNGQQLSSEFGPPALPNQPSSIAASQFSNNLLARKFANNAAGSPQLSWAEFLQDE